MFVTLFAMLVLVQAPVQAPVQAGACSRDYIMRLICIAVRKLLGSVAEPGADAGTSGRRVRPATNIDITRSLRWMRAWAGFRI